MKNLLKKIKILTFFCIIFVSYRHKDMIKACIFDLDGVIVDTAKYHFLAWQELAHSLNIEFTEEDNEHLKGVGRMESLEFILSLGMSS